MERIRGPFRWPRALFHACATLDAWLVWASGVCEDETDGPSTYLSVLAENQMTSSGRNIDEDVIFRVFRVFNGAIWVGASSGLAKPNPLSLSSGHGFMKHHVNKKKNNILLSFICPSCQYNLAVPSYTSSKRESTLHSGPAGIQGYFHTWRLVWKGAIIYGSCTVKWQVISFVSTIRR